VKASKRQVSTGLLDRLDQHDSLSFRPAESFDSEYAASASRPAAMRLIVHCWLARKRRDSVRADRVSCLSRTCQIRAMWTGACNRPIAEHADDSLARVSITERVSDFRHAVISRAISQ
jgi:hypothetical protein